MLVKYSESMKTTVLKWASDFCSNLIHNWIADLYIYSIGYASMCAASFQKCGHATYI